MQHVVGDCATARVLLWKLLAVSVISIDQWVISSLAIIIGLDDNDLSWHCTVIFTKQNLTTGIFN